MNAKTLASAILLALFVAGCATAPQLAPQPATTRTFDQPFDKIWGALVANISADYPLKIIEKASGVMETDLVQGAPIGQYALQPRVFLSCWGDTRSKLSVYVKAEGDARTSVRIIGHFEGFEYNTTRQWYLWPSTGKLETSILDQLPL